MEVPVVDPQIAKEIPRTTARRLSRYEYTNTIESLTGYQLGASADLLPEDAKDPFDNDYTQQLASAQLIQAYEVIAEEAAAFVMADPARRDAIIGCTPISPGDAACFETFLRGFGRLALRRPLTDEDVADFQDLLAYATEDNDAVDNDFYTAVDLALRVFLQHPELLFRIEIGTPDPANEGVVLLTDYELATRLSYLLWGTTPDADLLDKADAGQLRDAATRAATAREMLADQRARRQVARFHALWLGYHTLPHDADLVAGFQSETSALIDRVIFDEPQDYMNLFTSEETFIDDDLAAHYGLPAPGSDTPVWASYGADERRGILSHGSVLSVAVKWKDTSPTQRGLYVRNRLMCQPVAPPPPDLMVNVDVSPEEANPDACKVDAYAAHRENPSCAGCHSLTDPIGFGLERYDRAGAPREHDPGRPECLIDGTGELVGAGPFSGPGQLGQLLVDSGALHNCLAKQVFRYTYGRRERKDDTGLVNATREGFASAGQRFEELLITLVEDDSFAKRILDHPSFVEEATHE